MIKISAVICTYKRADYLRAALRSLCEQILPRDEFEIIVIDNAAEQETECVVNEFRKANVELRYLVENQVGLSHARNKALTEARGEYIAYLDDDARADEHWLEALLNTFEHVTPAPAAMGGRVWLDWGGERPAWAHDDLLPLFSFVDHGQNGHVLRPEEYLVGANMAFQCDALKTVGGFDCNLGRQGAVLLSGEEARVFDQLREQGLTIFYEPDAFVFHSVHPARQRPTWLLRRVFWDGASQPLLDSARQSRSVLLRTMLTDLGQCFRWSARACAATARGRKANAWKSLLASCQRAGRLRTKIRMLAWD